MRYYSAWICRFVSIDPLQFKYPELTPFQYASNRPITCIDLDGCEAREPEKNHQPRTLWGTIKDYFTTWISSFSPFEGENSRGRIYERAYVEGDRAALKQVHKIETVDKIAEIGETINNAHITPYVSVAVGKESSDGSLISEWHGLTLSSKGLYYSYGADLTIGAPSFLGWSASFSAGVSFDVFKGVEGPLGNVEFGVSAGYDYVGVSGSIKSSGSVSVGVTASTAPWWASVNLGYTLFGIEW